jgi:hypothetical protein
MDMMISDHETIKWSETKMDCERGGRISFLWRLDFIEQGI